LVQFDGVRSNLLHLLVQKTLEENISEVWYVFIYVK
jgi:hypothetical protein